MNYTRSSRISNDWKEIGYYEIVTDVNDLVMQGSLLILYPPIPAKDWVKPDLDQVINNLINHNLRLGKGSLTEISGLSIFGLMGATI